MLISPFLSASPAARRLSTTGYGRVFGGRLPAPGSEWEVRELPGRLCPVVGAGLCHSNLHPDRYWGFSSKTAAGSELG